jgi:hypothetical protein
MSRSGNYAKVGDAAFNKMEKVSAELLTLTYGAVVSQLLRDHADDPQQTNDQLEKMGYRIGLRIIDEFLAKANLPPCQDFRDATEMLAKVAVKMFLGVSAEPSAWNTSQTACSLVFSDNPLHDFAELPPHLVGTLWYSNLLAGIVRGAFEQVMMRVRCNFTKDVLHGDAQTVLRIELVEYMKDQGPGD